MSLSGPARVLVLVDEPLFARVIRLTLDHGVYVTRTVQDVLDAAEMLEDWRPHLAIVDIDNGGDRLVQRMGRSGEGGTRIPVLALTRRADLQTRLMAFEQGVDDVMSVPFEPDELLARMLVITRRSYGAAVTLNPVLRFDELEIDILRRRVRVGSSELRLTGLEQSLLYLLAANADRVMTRDEILDALWGPDYTAESNVIDRHVRNLRVKLKNGWRTPRFIATVPGRGYRFQTKREASRAS